MSANPYSVAAWRLLRDSGNPLPARASLADIPADAAMDAEVLGCWNGERFVSWASWITGIQLASPNVPGEAAEKNIDCWFARCGNTAIWIVLDGPRWLMYAGSRKEASRRKDFASPYSAHARRTAEEWYGTAIDGWHTRQRASRHQNAIPEEPSR